MRRRRQFGSPLAGIDFTKDFKRDKRFRVGKRAFFARDIYFLIIRDSARNGKNISGISLSNFSYSEYRWAAVPLFMIGGFSPKNCHTRRIFLAYGINFRRRAAHYTLCKRMQSETGKRAEAKMFSHSEYMNFPEIARCRKGTAIYSCCEIPAFILLRSFFLLFTEAM